MALKSFFVERKAVSEKKHIWVSFFESNDHKNATNNHILTPWDGKALQFGCLGGLPGFLKHVLPQESRCGKNGKSLQ